MPDHATMHLRSALLCVALSILLSACSPTENHRPAVAFILAGQSNMVGRGLLSELAEPLPEAPRNLLFFHHGRPTQFSETQWFGPEVGFAHELAQAWPQQRIVIIKFAVDGTSLFAWAPDWDPARAAQTHNLKVGPLYRKLMEEVGRATATEPMRLAALVWMQGESDAKYAVAGEQYGANLERFVERLRHHVGVPDLPFIYGQVAPPPDFPAARHVRAAQVEIQQQLSNVALVTTDDLPKREDGIHYNSAALVELGRRFARAYLAMER